ncbi:MAG: hypothetical protein H6592_13240 [Flavobacteriales bacterium]|nr:hypothetical protein [Flavobacteriales bacterium]
MSNGQGDAMTYFVGSWQLSIWSDSDTIREPDAKGKWEVSDGRVGAFALVGRVLSLDENKALTREFITYDPLTKQYDRTIAGRDSTLYRFVTDGFTGDSLIWVGKALRQTGETPMKEVIHRVGPMVFGAVFYVKDGAAWILVTWERLTRLE